ncbi:SDR family NAD(P)-dependent oxidoreductase [Streptomyces sp. NPDC005877]
MSGDRVAVAARTTAPLEALAVAHPGKVLPLGVDVTDRDAVFAAVAEAVGHFGRLDIVVNNAGMLAMGMVEEFTEAEARAQLDLNFFGALWVAQAVMPVLRKHGSGHLVQVSSIAALGGFPSSGLYSASKFAREGLSDGHLGGVGARQPRRRTRDSRTRRHGCRARLAARTRWTGCPRAGAEPGPAGRRNCRVPASGRHVHRWVDRLPGRAARTERSRRITPLPRGSRHVVVPYHGGGHPPLQPCLHRP